MSILLGSCAVATKTLKEKRWDHNLLLHNANSFSHFIDNLTYFSQDLSVQYDNLDKVTSGRFSKTSKHFLPEKQQNVLTKIDIFD